MGSLFRATNGIIATVLLMIIAVGTFSDANPGFPSCQGCHPEVPAANAMLRLLLGLCTVEARKLEHGFRRISARIPYTLP